MYKTEFLLKRKKKESRGLKSISLALYLFGCTYSICDLFMIFNIPFLILCISFTLFHCPLQIKWNDEFLSAQKWKKKTPSKGIAMRSNSKQYDDSTKLNFLQINSFFSKFMLNWINTCFLYCDCWNNSWCSKQNICPKWLHYRNTISELSYALANWKLS